MSDLGDVGSSYQAVRNDYCWGVFTRDKQPISVVVHIDDAAPTVGGFWTQNPCYMFKPGGGYIDRADTDSGGNSYFYDLEDGAYYVNQIGTGNAWSVTITGSTVVVVKLASFGTLIAVYAA